MKRINLMSGPGSGKSTTALWLTQKLRKNGFSVEYVDEFIKRKAYSKEKISSFDQFYIFARQLEKEDFYLKNGVEIICSDSPLILSLSYMTGELESKFIKPCLEMVNLFEKKYKSFNIFLNRGNLPYVEHGRWENYSQALERDNAIKEVMKKHLSSFEEVLVGNNETLLEKCLFQLNNIC